MCVVSGHNSEGSISRDGLSTIETGDETPIAAEYLGPGWMRPILVNRPTVCRPIGIRHRDPQKHVLDPLDSMSPGPCRKHDGRSITNEKGERVV